MQTVTCQVLCLWSHSKSTTGKGPEPGQVILGGVPLPWLGSDLPPEPLPGCPWESLGKLEILFRSWTNEISISEGEGLGIGVLKATWVILIGAGLIPLPWRAGGSAPSTCVPFVHPWPPRASSAPWSNEGGASNPTFKTTIHCDALIPKFWAMVVGGYIFKRLLWDS